MRVAEIIGTVTMSRSLSSFQGARLKLAVTLSAEQITGDAPLGDEVLVVYDELGAGIGSRIALTDGSEAAQPFRPALKPVDAYNAAILDEVNL